MPYETLGLRDLEKRERKRARSACAETRLKGGSVPIKEHSLQLQVGAWKQLPVDICAYIRKWKGSGPVTDGYITSSLIEGLAKS